MGERTAVVLLSGGLDSATSLAIAKDEGYDVYALSFSYGQRHSKEIECSKKLADHFGCIEYRVFNLGLDDIGGSALTDSSLEVPEDRRDISSEIPITYVPARNIIFLSFALAWAEVKKAQAIFIGANAIDYSGYPDCRPEFFLAFETMARLGTKAGVEGEEIDIKYPLIDLTKGQIIQKGLALGVPYEYTWSCYKGGEKACGKCDSCQLRLKGFEEAGTKDPVEYE